MKRRKRLNVRKLNERARELGERALTGEGLGLHEHDEVVRAHLEWLLEDWRLGHPLSEDDRDLLMSVVQDYVLHSPLPPGRPLKPQEARDEFDAAIAVARSYRAKLVKRGLARKKATTQTVEMLRVK